ncbi:MAG: DUF4838 domain-containing protein [Victivallales bacterium]|nr:DUF4838 domain-containing protein [Victivallales bacterium]
MRHWTGLLLLCLTATSVQADLVLARRGTAADTVIVHAVDAPESIKLACNEMQMYIERQTGVKLPIQDDGGALPKKAILVGKPRYLAELPGCQFPEMALPDDSFCLKTVGERLVIYGGKRGGMYGVYEILERFGGCRWYSSWCEVVPTLDEFKVASDLDEKQIPAFLMREPFWYDMFNTEQAYRNKCNGNQMRLSEKEGGKVRFGSGLFVHTMDQFIPVKEFYDTHPEYFAEIGGTRRNGYVQRCLTNPDVLKITTERLLDRIRKDPTATMYSVSQNDVYNFCTCKECNAMAEKYGGQSGLLIWFVNQVAEAVEKEFPNALVETLAYQYTRTPPVNIKPRHNVVPRLCTIECDFSKPLDVSKHPQNIKFVKDIEGWSSMTDKLFIWDYTTDFANYLCPFPNFGCLQGNVKFFRDNHVIGLMEQGAYQGYHAEFAELRGWILAKLLWNPDQDVAPLYDDFFNGYYGKGAPFIRKYFDELQSLVTGDDKILNIWIAPNVGWITDDFLDRSLKLWQDAEAAVKDDPVRLYNVRKSSIPVFFALYQRMPHDKPEYKWSDTEVSPLLTPKAAYICKELVARYDEADPKGVKRNIYIREGGNAQYQEWIKFAKTAPVVTINGRGCKAGIAPKLNAQVGFFRNAEGVDLLDATAGGFCFSNNLGGAFSDVAAMEYEIKTEGDDQLIVSTGKDGLEYTQSIGFWGIDNLICVTGIKNTSKKVQKIRPFASLALAINASPYFTWWLDSGHGDSGHENVCALQSGTKLDYMAIGGEELKGKKILTIVGADGQGVVIGLPDATCERIAIQYHAKGVRLYYIEPVADLPLEGNVLRRFVLRHFKGTTATDVKPADVNAPARIVYEDCEIPLNKKPTWGETVIDAEAIDKSAHKLSNSHYEWCIQLRPDMNLLDASKTYTVRARVKVVPKEGATGEAFWAGVYNTSTTEYYGNLSVNLKNVQPGYQWYVLSEKWPPHSTDYIWMGPPRFHNNTSPVDAVYLDRIEIIENKK